MSNVEKVGNVPKSIRDTLLIECDFSCCSCGQKYFCDVHHIKLKSEGGTNDPSNLIVLCPTCHRYAHRGAYSPSQLKKMKQKYIKSVEQRLMKQSQLTKIQEKQIADFVFSKCIEQIYPRENYTKLESEQIYFIAFDLVDIGLIVDPSNMAPILVSDDDIVELSSLEVISNPFRLMFLEELQQIEKKMLGLNFLIRVDVVYLMEELLDSFENEGDEYGDTSTIKNHREYLRSLIHLHS